MEQDVMGMEGPMLFNSPLETGIRALIILDAAYPRAFDLTELTWLDHLVVHTADIGGPASLHPDLPHRSGELLVRRPMVEQGLSLMRRRHLVVLEQSEQGHRYRAGDEGTDIIGHLRSDYARTLCARARWLVKHIADMSTVDIERVVQHKIGRWSIEFQSAERRLFS